MLDWVKSQVSRIFIGPFYLQACSGPCAGFFSMGLSGLVLAGPWSDNNTLQHAQWHTLESFLVISGHLKSMH